MYIQVERRTKGRKMRSDKAMCVCMCKQEKDEENRMEGRKLGYKSEKIRKDDSEKEREKEQTNSLTRSCDASIILFRETAPVSSSLRDGFRLEWECA